MKEENTIFFACSFANFNPVLYVSHYFVAYCHICHENLGASVNYSTAITLNDVNKGHSVHLHTNDRVV